MAWIDQHPDHLIERSEPAQALAWLREQAMLDAAALQKLDLFLHHWVLVLLQRPADSQGVLELMSLCQVAKARAPAEHPLRQRWQAFEDLLEAKRLLLDAAEAEPAAPLRHEAAIRQFIQAQPQQRASQTELAAHLGLSAGRVSQILGVLEGRGQVSRQRQGQQSWVRWTAPAEVAPAAPAASTEPRATNPHGIGHLGAQVFALRRAA